MSAYDPKRARNFGVIGGTNKTSPAFRDSGKTDSIHLYRSNAMYDTSTERREQCDEEALNFDISDAALEAAAGEIKYKAGNQTVAFCSGIDTCPS